MNQEFYAYYSTLSTVELLQIEAQKENYQPEAVEAVMAVLQSRTVTGEDHQALADIAAAEQEQAERKKEKQQARMALITKAADAARPDGEKTPEQQLILFCVALGIVYLYDNTRVFFFVFRAIAKGVFFDRSVLIALAEIIITPVMIFLLYKKKKVGWSMAVFVYTAALLLVIGEAFLEWGGPRSYYGRTSLLSVVVSLFIDGGVLYYLSTAKITGLFAVSKKWQNYTIVLSVAVTIILITFFLIGF